MAEHLAVNQGVVGSSPIASAIYGLLEKRLNSHAFHACIHGFESRTGHQMEIMDWQMSVLFLLMQGLDRDAKIRKRGFYESLNHQWQPTFEWQFFKA